MNYPICADLLNRSVWHFDRLPIRERLNRLGVIRDAITTQL